MTAMLSHGKRGVPLDFFEDKKIEASRYIELGSILCN